MCLSILNEEKDWVPTLTVVQILVGIQELLNSPNLADPAQKDAYLLCKENRPKYEERVKALAAAYAAELC